MAFFFGEKTIYFNLQTGAFVFLLQQDELGTLALATKAGKNIPNVLKKERSPDSLAAAFKACEDAVPGIRNRSLSGTYNCVGMVLGFRRTCIEPRDIPWILEDDGYRPLPARSEAAPGDIIVYRISEKSEPTHIALIVKTTNDLKAGDLIIECISQWGLDGEYFHRDDQIHPEYGKVRTYMTERKP